MHAQDGEHGECPRCGYDLSGVVAAWKDACDLEGVCSECGLRFWWKEILAPSRLGPGWSFEHGGKPSWRRWLRTAGRSLWPGALWRSLRLGHDVRFSRLALFALVALAVFHMGTLAAVVINHNFFGNYSMITYRDSSPWDAALWPYGQEVIFGTASTYDGMEPVLLVALAPAVFMPLAMLVLGQTFRAARVRRRHLARGFVYSLPVSLVAFWVGVSGVLTWIALPYVPIAIYQPAPPGARLIVVGALLLGPVFVGVWWYFFVSRYLRLRHPLAVTILMLVVATLATAVAGALLATRALARSM